MPCSNANCRHFLLHLENSKPLVETVNVPVSSLVGQDAGDIGSDDSVLCFLTCLDSVIEVVESPFSSLVVSSFSVSQAGTSLLISYIGLSL